MKTLEEELYSFDVPHAQEILRVFAEDEPSVMYILRNIQPRVREAVIYGRCCNA